MSSMTKIAMAQSLKNWLEKKPLNKITISDITNDCGVNRMTFYYHFKDIYDLLEWAILYEGQKALNGNKTVQTWQQGMENIFLCVLKDKTFFINAYKALGRGVIENYLREPVYVLTYGVVNEEAKTMSVSEEDKQFIALFYQYALIGIVLDWVKNDMKTDYKLHLAKIETILNGATKEALSKFRVD